MRKLIVLLMVVLVGCTADAQTMKPQIDEAITNAIQAKTPSVLNQNTPYYSYYLPPHMGRRFVNEVASVLVSNDDEIVLQLDVPSIISERFYNSNPSNTRQTTVNRTYFYEYEGTFVNESNESHSLALKIREQNNRYVIFIQSDHFVLSSSVTLSRVEDVVNDMIVILRSAVASQDKVISTYSNKQVINYQQQVLEMFEQVAPESGTLADMDRLIQGELDFSEYVTEGEEDGIDIPDIEEDEEQEEGN